MKSGFLVFGLVVLLGCFISVAQAQTPEILVQPTNQVVLAGSAASFSVAASGAAPLTYQWQFNGTNLPNGVITTVAGKAIAGYAGDGGAATNAELLRPAAVAVDSTGSLFIADTESSRIRRVGANGIITTVAGNGTIGYRGDGGAATNAGLEFPQGVAVDASGSLFIADTSDNRVRKVGANGIISTVAGNGTNGYSGDGGAATNAELATPLGLAVDASGNLFIADYGNARIRRVGTNGIISTVAGNGIRASSGDGHAATNAALYDPQGVAVDASGNLFIADPNSDRVRKVDTNGIIAAVAGNGSYGDGGDGGPATSARLSFPNGVAVDASGNLFIADPVNALIRQVGSNGIITTAVGNGRTGYSGDGGPSTHAELNGPEAVAVDASGNLFIADAGNARIRKVVFQRQSQTLVLNDAGAANAGAYDVVVSSPAGSVTSRVVTLQVWFPPAIVTQPQSQAVAAGSNAALSVTATGTAPLAYQWYFDGAPLAGQTNAAWLLSAAAFTDAGSYTVMVTNLYGSVTSAPAVLNVGIPPTITTQPVSQTNPVNGTASFLVGVSGTGPLTYQWQFDGVDLPPNPLITTVAGTGTSGYSGDGGAAAKAELNYPGGVALDASGNLFIADSANNLIRKVAANGIITTLAGNGTQGYSGDGGAATSAELGAPEGVALDASGNLFIADTSNNRVRKVGASGIITTVAGNGTNGYSGDGGVATHAQLSLPWGVAVDTSGSLFIADENNNVIRIVGTNGVITTAAGNGAPGYSGDGGAAASAKLFNPTGVAVDAFGNLFIADCFNSRIRKVGTGGIITTVAGNGTEGYSGDGGAATGAALSLPRAVAVDAFGGLFIADGGNNRIREVGANGIITTLAGTGTQGYSGDGGPPAKAGLSSPVAVALDASGNLLVADSGNQRVRKVILQDPALVLNNVGSANVGSYDVVVSSPYGSVISRVVSLQVLFPPALVTQPQDQSVAIGSNLALSVAATGAAPLDYQWYFDGAPLPGQTNAPLLLSAAGSNDAGSYRVVVTNLYGSVTSVAAVVTVGIAPAITAEPVSQTNLLNGTVTLSVAASGTGPLTYQWQFNGANLPRGLITTVAGNGTTGYSGDGGAATNAELSYPYGVAFDALGNLFIADQNNHVVRKVGTNGIITTVAGSGKPGYSGDGGAATNAELSAPSGVAVDASGNLFIADQNNNVIREVATYGIITTAVGNGTAGYSGDGGEAPNAELSAPAGVAADASGNLFIADQDNNVIREAGAYGLITTVAGNGIGRYSGDGGRAASAELYAPAGVAADASGDLFIADRDNFCIRKVTANGIITTVAGNGTPGYSGDGGAATKTELSEPIGVAVDAAGNLFIADSQNNRIREVGTNGIISTVAGNGAQGYSDDGGSATEAELSAPSGGAVDAAGNLFIADSGNQRIRKVVFLSQGPTLVLNNVAGANAGAYDVVVSSPYGSVTSRVVTLQVPLSPVLVTQPQSQTVAPGGNATLSVAATGSAPLYYQWYFDGARLAGRTNTSLLLSAIGPANAGSYDAVVTNHYGSVTSALAILSLWAAPTITAQPVSQAVPLNGAAAFSVAVSGPGPFSYQWQFNGANLPNRFITTAVGDGTPGYSGDGGPASTAELNDPFGVAVDASGNLFIADAANSCIRKVGTNGLISTVAGSGVAGYAGDGGPATAAQLWFPYGVAVDGSGDLFIADWFSCRVRKVGTNGIITTVAGNGTPGYSGDGGAAAKAQLQYPYGVAVDGSGDLFIADSGNNAVRKVGTGVITTVAGNGTRGYSGDGGAATSAELNFPAGVAVDASGNLFIADENNNCVRRVGTDGLITTVAGNGFAGSFGVGAAATNTELNLPYGVAVDAAANLFVADSSNNIVREVDISGRIATVAGNGTPGYFGDGGAPTSAELDHPTGVAVDAAGNLFIADQNDNVIREVFIPGPTLVLDNVAATNAGAYDVVVSNPYGSVTSSVVTLTLALGLPPLHALLVGRQAVQLQFQGTPGASYLLLSATDLTPPVDWRPVVTNVAGPSGAWTFTDTNVPSARTRFYRMSSTGQ